MLGAGRNDALHIDRFSLIVAVPSNPDVDGFHVPGNFGLGILVQLRFVSMQAKQLCHKQDLSGMRCDFHPHTGIYIKFLGCLFAFLRRLRFRLFIEKVK